MSKPILCIDFDGVLYSYTSGWQGPRVIPDPPVEGAIEWLAKVVTSNEFDVNIYSSRSRYWFAIRAMKTWLHSHTHAAIAYTELKVPAWKWDIIHLYSSMEPWDVHVHEAAWVFVKKIKFPRKKPPAFLQIDDRAMCFRGPKAWPDINTLLDFTPWHKGQKKCYIFNAVLSYILYVDGRTCSFCGSSVAQYFQKHYTECGYDVICAGDGEEHWPEYVKRKGIV